MAWATALPGQTHEHFLSFVVEGAPTSTCRSRIYAGGPTATDSRLRLQAQKLRKCSCVCPDRTATTNQWATPAAPNTLGSTYSIASTFSPNDWLTQQSTTANGGTPQTQSWTYDPNGAELTHGYGTSAPQQNG